MGHREEKFAHYDPELDRERQKQGGSYGRPASPPARQSGQFPPSYGGGPPSDQSAYTRGSYPPTPPSQEGGPTLPYAVDRGAPGAPPPLPYINQDAGGHLPPPHRTPGPTHGQEIPAPGYGRGAPPPRPQPSYGQETPDPSYGRGSAPPPRPQPGYGQEAPGPGYGRAAPPTRPQPPIHETSNPGGRGRGYGDPPPLPYDDSRKPALAASNYPRPGRGGGYGDDGAPFGTATPPLGAGRYVYGGLQPSRAPEAFDAGAPPAPISSEYAHQVYASVFSDPVYGGAVQYNPQGGYSEEPEPLLQQHHKEDVLRHPDQF